MGVPKLSLTVYKAAQETVSRLRSGIVALIVRDTGVDPGLYALSDVDDIPAALGVNTADYVRRAFLGYMTAPQRVLLSVIGAEDDLVTVGAAALAASDFDFLVGPPDVTKEQAQALAAWLKKARESYCIGKAVLPGLAADDMAVINFTASDLMVGQTKYTAGDYCSRIAGILAGTPLTASATYAPLEELTAVAEVADPDGAVDGGELILLHDGRKAKIARAVNSLVTLKEGQHAGLKKIKVAAALDLIVRNAKLVVEDSYIGRMSNSYDNKLLLVSALQEFLTDLEAQGVLQTGSSHVELDLDKQKAWLKEQGAAVSTMTDQEILAADTGSWVFIRMGGVILDAMEDFDIGFWMGGNAA